MQLGGTWLSAEVRQRRFRRWLCIYCAHSGHILVTCPIKVSGSPVKVRVLVSRTNFGNFASRPTIQVTLSTPSASISQVALVFSGSDSNFIDSDLAMKEKLKATSLNGRVLWQVSHQIFPFRWCFTVIMWRSNFRVCISACLSKSLWYPWLSLHNPQIDWRAGELHFHSDFF